ncbi:MAG: transcriptional regulator [Bacillota bacterium]|nr:transcriptional regulator [Bacillota bacterium]
MEILSIGEKIKRARVYKGYTLKDICGNTISVSKMSCIENDKVNPEEWILSQISEKLELDLNYLMRDVRSQIISNLEDVKSGKNAKIEQEALYNIEYCEEYRYYDLGFEFMHLLFNYYIDNGQINLCQSNTSKYYELCRKAAGEKRRLIYYLDIGRYLFNSTEYYQAASYYNTVRKTIENKSTEKDYDLLVRAIYNEALCYTFMKDYSKAYEIAHKLIEFMDYVNDNISKAQIYNIMALRAIYANDYESFIECEEKSFEHYESNYRLMAKSVQNCVFALIQNGKNQEAVEYLERAIHCFNNSNNKDMIEFILNVIDILLSIDQLDRAQTLCDEVLNHAINSDNLRLIEKGYYLKAKILAAQGSLNSAEMYMNLALDILLKYGTKKQIYARYMEIGNMYSRLNNIPDAIKFFSLAIALNKKI